MSRHADEIIKILTRCESSGNRGYEVYRDWLDLVDATLNMLPAHATSVANTGELAEDPPEVVDLWERLRKRYNPGHRLGRKGKQGYFDLFQEAFHILLEAGSIPLQFYGSSVSGNPDILGEIYMQYGYPNSWAGQFFTPWDVALLMARMTIDPNEVNRRIIRSCVNDPLTQAMMMAGMIAPQPDREKWFMERILPAAGAVIEPLTICDPCCGSGVMLLAAASQFPAWQINAGLVQFFGQDLDYGCVKMAQINFKLYGIDSSMLKAALELSQAELASLPDGARDAYTLAQEENANGNQAKVEAIARELRAGVVQQMVMPMFEEV